VDGELVINRHNRSINHKQTHSDKTFTCSSFRMVFPTGLSYRSFPRVFRSVFLMGHQPAHGQAVTPAKKFASVRAK
jgi:hypothetical protein